ncbi:type VII secretion protein EccE [Jidongwangia harbinensis]|uniref:type VII secretion protein EccE n=1 Tax=Jidongwangia harbinensis TaxID=2878561 RepID=UPI001CDA1F84|nr:type VII secretion protein EccE [Jidongwangia harbinensis]MCA2214583.1 type VII secretion protein EccE [Jidongwangia harbinensis]
MTTSLTGRDLADLGTPLDGKATGTDGAARSRPVHRGRILGIRTGQLLGTQLAAVLLLAGARHGTMALIAATPLAVGLLAATWLRVRGRWAFEWVGTAARYAGRRHSMPVDASPTALIGLVAPGARVEHADLAGDPAAVVVDGSGLTAILELGDPAGLLAEDVFVLPSPAALLPPAGPDHPPCRIQVLLTGVPAPAVSAGNGTPANSYRQLTEGRLLGHGRALLTVHVRYAEGWSPDDLRRTLSGLVRKARRRLGTVPARPLGEAAALRVIAELAHDDGTPARETWSGLRIGGLAQTTFRLRQRPGQPAETTRRLVSRILASPASATTVAVAAGHRIEGGRTVTAVDVTVRLAAPDAAALTAAGQALRKLLAPERARADRLDGAHLDGLAASLPLGGGAVVDVPGRITDRGLPADAAGGLELSVGAAGVMLGLNRGGEPVVARLFRPEQTRILLVGGVRCAQLLALRAMALGARVVVQTSRPHAWEPFVRGAAVPGESIAVVPPGRAVPVPPGSALHPLLVVVDVGPVGADTRPGGGWQATLVVRDDFGPADVDVASRADLLVLQPLRADEADLVGAAVGLGETAQWLTRIRADMVGLVNRRAVRWAALAPTPIEAQLVGPPARG